MHFNATFLSVLACAAFAYGRSVNTRSLTTWCPNAVPVHSETIGDTGITMTHFSCGNTTDALLDLHSLVDEAPSGQLQSRGASPVFPRQFQNCVDGAADTECECAVLCGAIPFCGTGALPTQSDCQFIANTLSTVAGSFFVDSGFVMSFSFQSCEAAFVNEATTEKEFCFENMASLTSATWVNCMELQGGGVGGCIGDDFNYFFE
ncbi:hypothetical protein EUX98_g2620 [Antrodiella citrinella]|uniref:Uncharacterized protein n=1 Tax=Antrodiella citrinella TaxID=2447956 RepID=A0A4S4MYL5_9APHY|nr:hypothetical protein EUX98_g2620 [Antrodiella citrinella]